MNFIYSFLIGIVFFGCNAEKVILKNTDLARKLVCESSNIDTFYKEKYLVDTSSLRKAKEYDKSIEKSKRLIDSISKLMPYVNDLEICKDYFALLELSNKELQKVNNQLSNDLKNQKVIEKVKIIREPKYVDSYQTLAKIKYLESELIKEKTKSESKSKWIKWLLILLIPTIIAILARIFLYRK